MTTIHIVVCDICGRRARSVQPFSAMRGGKLVSWDVGECCMDTRFQICEHRKVDVAVTVQL